MKVALQIVLFLGYFALRGAEVHLTCVAFLLPVLILIMAALSLGLGIIFSSMTTKYRDLSHLLGFGVRLLMYATPVIFPLSSLTGKYRLIIGANPMSPIIETFRYGFLGTGTFSWWSLGYSALWAAAMLFVGMLMFTRIERTFMDTV